MAGERGEGPVADFCARLKRLQQSSGRDLTALAGQLSYSRSQLYEILSGRISRPPEWSRLVEPLVRACTGNDEREIGIWRRRHDVLVRVWTELRRQDRQDDTVRLTGKTEVVPAQLPADVSFFTGRTKELAELDHFLATPSGASNAAMISVVSGTAGVGKTALTVHWAHRIRSEFPDGQLYVNLHGYDSGPPVTPLQVLDDFLRALDVPIERIPASMEQRAALYRSLLDKRRVLVVLDNANATKQVRPLLPGSPGCLAVVTSRSRLAGLIAREGAHRVTLDALPSTEAIVLLRQIMGKVRVDAEPAAAVELAHQCACLPLALRIAAERVTSHPHIKLGDLTGELANERDRLDALVAQDDEITAVRSLFFWSYRALPPATARVFRLLGLHPGPDISIPVAAALAGISTSSVRRLLDVLTSVHLLEETGPNRYRFHDLLRVYAAERAAVEETDHDHDTAVRRMLIWYLNAADAAGHVLTPQWCRLPIESPEASCVPLTFTTYHQALDWCETERANLVAAIRHAAECGQHVVAWKLPGVLWGFFNLRGHWADWITTHEIALEATRHLHDKYGEAWISNNLGDAYRGLGYTKKALNYLQHALATWREIGDRWSEGWTLYNLGTTYRGLGRFGEALDYYHQVLARSREMGKRWTEGWALHSLGTTYRGLGRITDAFSHYHEALIIRREIKDRWGEGWTLHSLSITYRSIGRIEEALQYLDQALIVYCKINDRRAEGRTLYRRGEVLYDTGQLRTASEAWRQALVIFEELRDPYADEVRTRINTLETEGTDQNL